MTQSLANQIKQSLGGIEWENTQQLADKYKSITSLNEIITFVPTPGLVAKTRITNCTRFTQDSKLFINICSSPTVVAASLDNADMDKVMRGDKSIFSKMPVALSQIRSDVDKSGVECFVVDACVNPQLISPTAIMKLKMQLIECIVAKIEGDYELKLSRGN